MTTLTCKMIGPMAFAAAFALVAFGSAGAPLAATVDYRVSAAGIADAINISKLPTDRLPTDKLPAVQGATHTGADRGAAPSSPQTVVPVLIDGK